MHVITVSQHPTSIAGIPKEIIENGKKLARNEENTRSTCVQPTDQVVYRLRFLAESGSPSVLPDSQFRWKV